MLTKVDYSQLLHFWFKVLELRAVKMSFAQTHLKTDAKKCKLRLFYSAF